MSHIETMEKMIECLTEKAKSYIDSGFESADAEELGEVMDMIKDLSEAKYKCTVTKAMKEDEEEDKLMEKLGMDTEDRRFYSGRRGRSRYYGGDVYRDMNRDMDREYGRMYYSGNPSGYGNSSGGMGYSGSGNSGSYSGGRMGYSDGGRMSYTDYSRNESRYDRARRNYTESKEMHKANTSEDKQAKVRELENYMGELSSDLTELIMDMTPEEKNTMRSKLNQLVAKIQ